MRWTAHRTLQQPADALPKDRLGGQADGVFVSLGFEKRLDFRAFRSSWPAHGGTYTPQFNVMDVKKPRLFVRDGILSYYTFSGLKASGLGRLSDEVEVCSSESTRHACINTNERCQ